MGLRQFHDFCGLSIHDLFALYRSCDARGRLLLFAPIAWLGADKGEVESKQCPQGHMCPSGSAMAIPCLPDAYMILEYLDGALESARELRTLCGNVEAPEEGAQTIFFPKLCVEAGLCPLGKICPKEVPGKPTSANVALRGNSVLLPASQLLRVPAVLAFFAMEVAPALVTPPHSAQRDIIAQKVQEIPYRARGAHTNLNRARARAKHVLKVKQSVFFLHESIDIQVALQTPALVLPCIGSYCPPESSAPKECPAGFYCPAGTRYEYQYPCPQGTYGKIKGATSINSCEPCEGGHLCFSPGTGIDGSNAITNCPPVSLVDSVAILQKGVTRGEAQKGQAKATSTLSGFVGLSFNHITEELIVADYGNSTISALNLSTGDMTEIYNVLGKIVAISLLDHNVREDIATNLSEPWGLCLSSDGKKLYVAETGASKVSIITLETKAKKELDITGGLVPLVSPRGIALSPDGDIYIVQSGTHKLLRVNKDAEAEEVEILPPLLRTMKDKKLVYELGEITSVAYGQLSSPTLFLTDAQKHVIWKLDLETNRLEQILGTGEPGYSGDGRIIPAPEAQVDKPMAVALGEQGQGQANITARCSDGYYCPEGSSSITEVPCPPGHFCKNEGTFTNVALEAEVETQSAADFVNGNLPELVADGEVGSESTWISKINAAGHTITVDFGDLYFIREIRVISGTQEGDNVLSNFIVHYLHGASGSYLELFAVYDNSEHDRVSTFGEVASRKVMLTTTDPQVFISEIEVEGTSSPGQQQKFVVRYAKWILEQFSCQCLLTMAEPGDEI
ncbi:hypothetical protein Emed_002705 [Eimeria media]